MMLLLMHDEDVAHAVLIHDPIDHDDVVVGAI